MTQQDVADRLGVRQQAVNRWEVGRERPRHDNIRALRDLFGWDGLTLGKALGYLDPAESGEVSDRPMDTAAVLRDDPALTEQSRVILLAAYQAALGHPSRAEAP